MPSCRAANILLALALSACGGVQFERTAPQRLPLPPDTAVEIASRLEDVEQPAVVLGVLRLPQTRDRTAQGPAQIKFVGQAAQRGCDAIVAATETPILANSVNTDGSEQAVGWQWSAQCVRSGQGATARPVGAEPVAVARPREVPKAREVVKVAERVPDPPPAPLRKVVPPVKTTPEPPARPTPLPPPPPPRVAVTTPADTAPAETCRRLLPKCKPGKPKPECECTLQTLVDLAAARPEGTDAQAIWDALQRTVATQKSTDWVTVQAPVVSAEEEERGPPVQQDTLQAEMRKANATGWKLLTPRDYTYRYTLRNPTRNQLVVDVQLAGERVSRFLTPGQNLVLSHTARCTPHGAVRTQRIGLILEFHFDCDAQPEAQVLAVRPVRRELAVDRRACDVEPPLETVARVWQALPGTRLADVYLQAIDAELRRMGQDVATVAGRLTVYAHAGTGPLPVAVSLQNSGPRDITVVFDVGPVRDQAVVVRHGGSADQRLEVPAGSEPVLALKGLLPPLNTPQWLTGRWTFHGAQLVVLPIEKDHWLAFFRVTGSDGTLRMLAAPIQIQGGVATFQAELPALWLDALLGVKSDGFVRFTARLDQQHQFVFGGGRAMPVEVEAGKRKGTVVFSANR